VLHGAACNALPPADVQEATMLSSDFRRLCVAAFLTLWVLAATARAQDLNFDRSRVKAMLSIVSSHVEKNFYDPNLKGLEWKALIEDAKRKIDSAQNRGDMFTAVFSVLNKLDDSHTIFLPPGRVSKPHFGFEAKAFGDRILVHELKKDGAAAKAGLQLGDELIAVNGYNAQRDSFDVMMLYFRVLRPVAAMQLSLVRGGRPMDLKVDAKMETGTVVTDLTDSFNIWELIREAEADEEIFHYANYDGGVGYLGLTSFTGDEELYYRLMRRLDDSRAMVIDLRGNPGGAISMLSLVTGFFESQPVNIADLVGRKKTEPVKAKPHKPNFSVPMFILVDSQSASAAELFARHFQRTGRAVVIGDHTSGRVTAARFYSETLGQDSVVPYGVQVAFARVVLPGGEDLEKKGVTPEHKCIPTGEDLHRDHDPCLQVAIRMARKAIGLPEEPPEDKADKDKK
jgi:carboxyl-terminal processing protease